MATVKSCMAKLRKAGYDTTLINLDITEAADGDVRDLVMSRIGELRREHVTLRAKRQEVLESVSKQFPDLQPAVDEHIVSEQPAVRERQGPVQPGRAVQEGLAAGGQLGVVPVAEDITAVERAAAGAERSVPSAASTATMQEVSRILDVMRSVQKRKPLEELSPATALKQAKETGEIDAIRKAFPEATSAIQAIRLFQKAAREQSTRDPSAVPSESGEVRGGDSVVTDRTDDGQSLRVEAVTASGQTDVGGVRSITGFVSGLFPGSRWGVEDVPGQGPTYVIEQENVPPAEVDGTPQQLASSLIRALLSGRATKRNRLKATHPDLKKADLNSIDVTKIGAVVDAQTNDANLRPIEKSYRQFLAGVAYLRSIGFDIKTKGNPVIDTRGTTLGDAKESIDRAVKLTEIMRKTEPRLEEARRYVDGLKEAVESGTATRQEREDYFAALGTVIGYFNARRELEKDGAELASGQEDSREIEQGAGQDAKSKDSTPVAERGQKETANERTDSQGERLAETEAVQAARSRGETGTYKELIGATLKQHPSPKEVLPKETRQASNRAAKKIFDTLNQRKALGKVPKNFIGLMNNLFETLGIKTKVIVVDRESAQELLKGDLPKEWRENLERVLADEPGGRLMLSNSNAANERFAMVYIDTSKNIAHQQVAFMHELGHIVQLAKLDTASPEVQSALREAHANTKSQQEFEEWFANEFLHWAHSKKIPKTTLEKFFKELVKSLKQLYNKFRGVNQTYEQFMDSLVEVQRQRRTPEKPASGRYRRDFVDDLAGSVDSPFLAKQERSFYDLHPESKVTAGVLRKGSKLLETSKDAAMPFHEAAIQSADAYLRANGLERIADIFHKRPDVSTTRRGATFEQKIRADFGSFDRSITKVVEKLPKHDGWRKRWVNVKDPKYREAARALILEQETDNQIVLQAREYFQEVADYLEANGIKINRRKKYFPVLLDIEAWNANPERVMEIAQKKLGMNEDQARQLYLKVSRDPALQGIQSNYDPYTAGSFSHTKAREFGPREHEAFIEFIDSDIASVVKNYTHSAVKHVNTVREFNPNLKGPKGQPADPLFELRMQMATMLQKGEISTHVYDRFWKKIMPAYFGQLGADIHPTLRKLQSGLVFFQNIRLLGFAQLASLPDLAGVVARTGTLKGQWTEFKAALGDMKSDEMQALYREIGLIRDDLTEAIMNDPTHTQFYSPKVRRANEIFFRYNGMHALTNLSRIYSFRAGQRFMLEMAKTNNKKRLDEMGVTREEILQWDRDGQPINRANGNNENILFALHQFVDESILRPSAPMRPPWMSDQKWLIVANLKSFIFTYYETILRRIWSQYQAGEISTKNLAGLVPVAAYFAVAMTLAMVGYETRKSLAAIGDELPEWAEKDGFEYYFELLQRMGALGPMQFLVDAVEAESRGKLALMSVLGPTASQFEMLMTKDLSYSLPRSVPVFAQSYALRNWAQGALE